jgi:hypothetical protein
VSPPVDEKDVARKIFPISYPFNNHYSLCRPWSLESALMLTREGVMADLNERENKRSEESDWFLQALVGFVDGTEREIGITLQARGIVLSGFLVSGHKYFDGFADDFATAVVHKEAAGKIRQEIAKFGDQYKTKPKADHPLPMYLHLKKPRMYGPGVKASPNWWRGRVSEVSGYFLGVLAEQQV